MDTYLSAVAYDQAQRQTAGLVRDHDLRRRQAVRRGSFVRPVRAPGRIRRTGKWLRAHIHLHRHGSGGTPALPAM